MCYISHFLRGQTNTYPVRHPSCRNRHISYERQQIPSQLIKFPTNRMLTASESLRSRLWRHHPRLILSKALLCNIISSYVTGVMWWTLVFSVTHNGVLFLFNSRSFFSDLACYGLSLDWNCVMILMGISVMHNFSNSFGWVCI